jgi:hypothetical protein
MPLHTVLDGELVYNRLRQSFVFLVFDVLLWESEAVMCTDFGARLLRLHQ